jgi:pilus assembly protein CpaB
MLSRSRVLRFVVIPVAAGLLAVWAVSSATGSQRRASAAAPTQTVVVARAALAAHTRLTAGQIEVRSLPVGAAGPGAVSSLDAAVGRITTEPLAQGEVLYGAALAAPGARTGLAYAVPAGYLAQSVAVTAVSGVSGFVQAGDRVDVIAVSAQGPGGKPAATLLLQNLRVLAVGAPKAGGGPAPAGTAYSTVTLAVHPANAVALALAAREGGVDLVLRPAVPEPDAPQTVVTMADLVR